jgi:xanthine dehydrogenase accessory factor
MIAKVHGREENALPGLEFGDIFAEFDDLARNVAAEDMRQLNAGQAFAHPDIEMVQAAGANPYEHLVLAKLRVGGIFVAKNLRATEFVNANGFHGLFDFPSLQSNNDTVDFYEEIVALRRQGRRGAVATIVNVRGSVPSFETAKMLVREDGSIVGTVGGGCVEAEVWQAARDVMETEKPRTLTFNLNQSPKYDTGLVCGGTLDIFIEPLLPAALLYIFGAGHISLSLYSTAKKVGFEVTVVDDRDSYANRERFPDAKEVIAADFDQAMAQISPNETSYIVVVTRGHRDDMRVLRWAVQTQARYVGMIGSKRKTITIFRELVKEGVPERLFERVHAPVGLDIGAITPEEIAVAITAELIAARRRVERALPHMSWFHSRTVNADESKAEPDPEKV